MEYASTPLFASYLSLGDSIASTKASVGAGKSFSTKIAAVERFPALVRIYACQPLVKPVVTRQQTLQFALHSHKLCLTFHRHVCPLHPVRGQKLIDTAAFPGSYRSVGAEDFPDLVAHPAKTAKISSSFQWLWPDRQSPVVPFHHSRKYRHGLVDVSRQTVITVCALEIEEFLEVLRTVTRNIDPNLFHGADR